MKKFIITSILAVLVAFGTTVMAQEYPDEYLGLPGDNLNLYAVMKLFQESETLEGFERSLNDKNSKINNLDLNGDNYVDYIMVFDYVDGDVHTIVLRVALAKNEFQDVAVFTVQKFRDGSVQIQLIGDEALYGQNYIIEPYYEETPNPGYMGKNNRKSNVTIVYTDFYEIADWPMIRFMYYPDYVMWHSSWYWGYYPPYWDPWQPYYWHYYYGYHYNWGHHYYNHYRHWDHPRYHGYNDFYYSGIRSHSPQIDHNINDGKYKSTYSHPEQRRDGEALFTSTHPDQEKRTQENTPVISQTRRSVSQSTRDQATTRTTTGSTRRSDNVSNSRSATDPSNRQSTVDSRRSTTTAGDRPVTKSSSDQNTGAVRRSTTTVEERPVTKSSSDEASVPVRRPADSGYEKPASRPEPSERVVETRREPEPVQERVISRPEPAERVVSRPEPVQKEEAPRVSRPAESHPERKSAPVETKTETVTRRADKPEKPEESDRSR
jgi:hypothetical protein